MPSLGVLVSTWSLEPLTGANGCLAAAVWTVDVMVKERVDVDGCVCAYVLLLSTVELSKTSSPHGVHE